MALPAYIDAETGEITDGEAWVGIASAEPSSADVQFVSTDDGQVGDFSQYMDLKIVGYVRSLYSGVSTSLYLNLNNDTGSNYAQQYLYGSGAAAASGSVASTTYAYAGWIAGNTATANIFSAFTVDLFDINSGKYKSVIAQSADDRDGAGYVSLFANTWKSQAAITEIDLTGVGVTLLAGTRIDLFGILPRMVA